MTVDGMGCSIALDLGCEVISSIMVHEALEVAVGSTLPWIKAFQNLNAAVNRYKNQRHSCLKTWQLLSLPDPWAHLGDRLSARSHSQLSADSMSRSGLMGNARGVLGPALLNTRAPWIWRLGRPRGEHFSDDLGWKALLWSRYYLMAYIRSKGTRSQGWYLSQEETWSKADGVMRIAEQLGVPEEDVYRHPLLGKYFTSGDQFDRKKGVGPVLEGWAQDIIGVLMGSSKGHSVSISLDHISACLYDASEGKKTEGPKRGSRGMYDEGEERDEEEEANDTVLFSSILLCAQTNSKLRKPMPPSRGPPSLERGSSRSHSYQQHGKNELKAVMAAGMEEIRVTITPAILAFIQRALALQRAIDEDSWVIQDRGKPYPLGKGNDSVRASGVILTPRLVPALLGAIHERLALCVQTHVWLGQLGLAAVADGVQLDILIRGIRSTLTMDTMSIQPSEDSREPSVTSSASKREEMPEEGQGAGQRSWAGEEEECSRRCKHSQYLSITCTSLVEGALLELTEALGDVALLASVRLTRYSSSLGIIASLMPLTHAYIQAMEEDQGTHTPLSQLSHRLRTDSRRSDGAGNTPLTGFSKDGGTIARYHPRMVVPLDMAWSVGRISLHIPRSLVRLYDFGLHWGTKALPRYDRLFAQIREDWQKVYEVDRVAKEASIAESGGLERKGTLESSSRYSERIEEVWWTGILPILDLRPRCQGLMRQVIIYSELLPSLAVRYELTNLLISFRFPTPTHTSFMSMNPGEPFTSNKAQGWIHRADKAVVAVQLSSQYLYFTATNKDSPMGKAPARHPGPIGGNGGNRRLGDERTTASFEIPATRALGMVTMLESGKGGRSTIELSGSLTLDRPVLLFNTDMLDHILTTLTLLSSELTDLVEIYSKGRRSRGSSPKEREEGGRNAPSSFRESQGIHEDEKSQGPKRDAVLLRYDIRLGLRGSQVATVSPTTLVIFETGAVRGRFVGASEEMVEEVDQDEREEVRSIERPSPKWSLSATGVGLSLNHNVLLLAPSTRRGLDSEKYRLASVVVDFSVAEEARPDDPMKEDPSLSQDSLQLGKHRRQLTLRITRFHAVMQPVALGKFIDVYVYFARDLQVKRAEKAEEIRSFTANTKALLDKLDLSGMSAGIGSGGEGEKKEGMVSGGGSEGSASSTAHPARPTEGQEKEGAIDLGFLSNHRICIQMENVAIVAPLVKGWESSSASGEKSNSTGFQEKTIHPALLMTARTIDFLSHRGEKASGAILDLRVQFVPSFSQDDPRHFSPSHHVSFNSVLFPSLACRIRSSRKMSEDQEPVRRIWVEGLVHGMEMDWSSDLVLYVNTLDAIWQYGKDRMAHLTEEISSEKAEIDHLSPDVAFSKGRIASLKHDLPSRKERSNSLTPKSSPKMSLSPSNVPSRSVTSPRTWLDLEASFRVQSGTVRLHVRDSSYQTKDSSDSGGKEGLVLKIPGLTSAASVMVALGEEAPRVEEQGDEEEEDDKGELGEEVSLDSISIANEVAIQDKVRL